MSRPLRERVLASALGGAWYRLFELRQSLAPSALRERRLARRVPTPDGFALPPPRRIACIGADASTRWYVESGPRDVDRILARLSAVGLDAASLGAVLDFGCGCGRLTRGLARSATRLVGCDVDRAAVAWCDAHLPGEFHAIRLDPPVPLADASIDVVVAYSVFTHLDEPRFRAWLAELHRVLAPGGHLAMTVHGTAYRELIPAADRGRFDAGDMVVRYPRSAGSNLCAAFHPRAFVERALSPRFAIVDFEEGGPAHAAAQDLYVARA